MSGYLDQWYQRKRTRRLLSIKEPRTARFKHNACLGPRRQFAVVEMRGIPSGSFSFESHATWPDSRCDYSDAVLDGMLDELFSTGIGPTVANVRFILEEIEWHDVDSSAVAFYHAARGAVREILGTGAYPGNVDWNFGIEGNG